MINIEDFKKVEIKIGKIISAEPVEGSEKLLKIMVDFKEDKLRQVISGIAKYYSTDSLAGKKCAFVTNLLPKLVMGLESQAMILAAKDANTLSILFPDQTIEEGTVIS